MRRHNIQLVRLLPDRQAPARLPSAGRARRGPHPHLLLPLLIAALAAACRPQTSGRIGPDQPVVRAAIAEPTRRLPEAEPGDRWPDQRVGPALVPSALEAAVPLIVWNNSSRQFELQLVDPATGQDHSGRPPIGLTRLTGYVPTLARSADGHTLAVVTGQGSACAAVGGGSGCRPAADCIGLIDLRTGQQRTVDLAAYFPEAHSPFKGWAGPLAFSPNASRLAVAYHNREGTWILLFDVSSGELTARQSLPLRPRLMEFSGDGGTLAIYASSRSDEPSLAQPDPPNVFALDGLTLVVRWSEPLGDVAEGSWCVEGCEGLASNSGDPRVLYFMPAVAFSPGHNRLYVVHADADRLTRVDLAAQRVSSSPIGPARGRLERVLDLTAEVAEAKYWPEGAKKWAALSPDGARLYVIGRSWDRVQDADGERQIEEIFLGLQVVGAQSGLELATYPLQADWIGTTPDRRLLLLRLGREGLTEVRDAQTLVLVGQVEGWELTPAVSLGGRPVLLLRSRAGEAPTFPTQLALLRTDPFGPSQTWYRQAEAYWAAP
jgi:hypothetical protein